MMFPQLMLESGLLYFLVESGQVQGQAGVGGRDWGILCHWRRGGGEEKEHISTVRHQRHNTTLQFYSFFGSQNGALLPCYRLIVTF